MVRPVEFEDLKTTSVSVGRKQLAAAKKAGLNISEILRNGIEAALRSPALRARTSKEKKLLEKKLKGVPKSRMRRALEMIVGSGLPLPRVAEHHARIINRQCNTELRGSDLLAMIPRY